MREFHSILVGQGGGRKKKFAHRKDSAAPKPPLELTKKGGKGKKRIMSEKEKEGEPALTSISLLGREKVEPMHEHFFFPLAGRRGEDTPIIPDRNKRMRKKKKGREKSPFTRHEFLTPMGLGNPKKRKLGKGGKPSPRGPRALSFFLEKKKKTGWTGLPSCLALSRSPSYSSNERNQASPETACSSAVVRRGGKRGPGKGKGRKIHDGLLLPPPKKGETTKKFRRPRTRRSGRRKKKEKKIIPALTGHRRLMLLYP